LAIVPFLHGGLVDQFHWLNEQQFLDAVAVAMITPGPVVITVAFVGFLVAGPAGAVLAALAVFLPCYLLVILLALYYRYLAGNDRIKAFVQGITAMVIGAIAGSAVILGRRALAPEGRLDFVAASITVGVLAVLLPRRVPEPAVILAAGLAGLLLKQFCAA